MLTRIATALVLFVIFAGSLWFSPMAFEFVMTVAFVMSLVEWLKIEGVPVKYRLGAGLMSLLVMAHIVWHKIAITGPVLLILMLAVTVIWLAIFAICYNAREVGFALQKRQSLYSSFLLVFSAWFAFMWFMQKGGWPLMLSVFAIVWIADIFAYFTGVAFGKHKMAPAISPKKSWEGVIGAYVFIYIAVALAWIYLPHESVFTSQLLEKIGPVASLTMIFLLVAISISGDLFESALKRHANVKDSGSCLPGHGGFYDRLDAAIAVFPCACACLLIA